MDSHLIVVIMFSLTYWKSYARICGTEIYYEEEEICCNSRVLPRWDRATGEEADCCQKLNTTYNPLSHICCGHHMLNRLVGDQEQHCCGETVYTEDQGYCCDGRYYQYDNHPGRMMDCCGRQHYDLNLQHCCVHGENSKVHFLNLSIKSPGCCHLELFDEAMSYCDWETGQILDFNQEWCGSEIIDVSKKICCNGQAKDLPKNMKNPHLYICCGPLVINRFSETCCETSGGDYRHIPATHNCCGNSDYDPDTQECCSNTVVKRPGWPHKCCGTELISLLYTSSDECCNGQKINKHNQKCCGKKIIESSGECCGPDELTSDSVCCKHWALPDIMIKKVNDTDTKCCRLENGSNLLILYNHHTQTCSAMDGIRSKGNPSVTTSTTKAKAMLVKSFPIYHVSGPKTSLRTERTSIRSETTPQGTTTCPACEDAQINKKHIISSACGKKYVPFELKKIIKVRNGKVTAGVRNKSRKQRRSKRHLKRRNLRLNLPASCSCMKAKQQYQLYTNQNVGNRKILFIKDDDLILPKDKRIRKKIRNLCI